MRPPSVQRSSLRYRLDDILGSHAAVRLLRVLIHDSDGPVAVTDAARMAGLSPAGARKSFEGLTRAGITTLVGTGRAQKYGIVEDCPYVASLRDLFEREQRQYDDLILGVRAALDMPEIRHAWVERPLAQAGESLQVTAVVETKAVSWIGQEIRTRLVETERRFDLIIEIAVFTRADAPEQPDDALLLWGASPAGASESRPGARSNQESVARSLRMAQAVAGLIKTDPSLVRRAWQQTDRLLREGQGTADADIGEWRQLLESYSPDRVRDLLVSTSSRAERLRRSSPFFAVLTGEERDRVMKELGT